MSQNRFWISTHYTYEAASAAKDRAQNDNPDGIFQIRKGKDKGVKEVFRLVQRFKDNEATVIRDTKKQAKSRRKKREDFSWITANK